MENPESQWSVPVPLLKFGDVEERAARTSPMMNPVGRGPGSPRVKHTISNPLRQEPIPNVENWYGNPSLSSIRMEQGFETNTAPKPLRSSMLCRDELAVIRGVSKGWSNLEIANTLGWPEQKVAQCIDQVLKKLKLSSRIELTFYACSAEGQAVLRNPKRGA